MSRDIEMYAYRYTCNNYICDQILENGFESHIYNFACMVKTYNYLFGGS